jgi:dsRNA-specific ribonuclease
MLDTRETNDIRELTTIITNQIYKQYKSMDKVQILNLKNLYCNSAIINKLSKYMDKNYVQTALSYKQPDFSILPDEELLKAINGVAQEKVFSDYFDNTLHRKYTIPFLTTFFYLDLKKV